MAQKHEEISCWYAVRVRSRCEKLAAIALLSQNFEVVPALAPQRRVWIDRVRTVEMPLFPGYIFARFPLARRIDVEKAAGVVSIVRFGEECCPVDPQEIEAIRIVLGSGAEVYRAPFLPLGQIVAVKHGPLAGARGFVTEVENRYRLIVSVTLLQRSVGVDIDETMIEPLWPSPVAYSSHIEAN